MQSPLIEIGAYWFGETEAVSFHRMLKWLLTRGYELPSGIWVLKTVPGKFPVFDDTKGLEKRAINSIEELERSALLQNDWVPVEIPLKKKDQRQLAITLSYAPVFGANSTPWEHHPVEITASGTSANLLENVKVRDLPSKTVNRARKQTRWERETFHDLVKDLAPDIAKHSWEWALQPPSSLVESTSVGDFDRLYLSSAIVQIDDLTAQFRDMSSWMLENIISGTLLTCTDWAGKDTLSGIEVIRDLLRPRVRQAKKEWISHSQISNDDLSPPT